MTLSDRLLTRKRSILETIDDELKHIAQMKYSRHQSFNNFMVNMFGGFAAYCFFRRIHALPVKDVTTIN